MLYLICLQLQVRKALFSGLLEGVQSEHCLLEKGKVLVPFRACCFHSVLFILWKFLLFKFVKAAAFQSTVATSAEKKSTRISVFVTIYFFSAAKQILIRLIRWIFFAVFLVKIFNITHPNEDKFWIFVFVAR